MLKTYFCEKWPFVNKYTHTHTNIRWLRTGSNPAYIDQFLSQTGKYFLTERNNFVEKCYFCFAVLLFSTKSITQVKTLAVKDCIMELVEYLI